ncbi:MAG: DUF6383 domain-containing protein [Tannerella sp.]|jgi:hypothetical protein|nr:DUF6383 domain-containing protein [Tannerella sp.]
MNKKIATLCIGLFVTAFAFSGDALSSVGKVPLDSVRYYLKIDTLGINVGYLRTSGENLIVNNVKDVKSMWYVKHFETSDPGLADPDRYVLINAESMDTLRLISIAPGVSGIYDILATISENGEVRFWDVKFELDPVYNFKAPYWRDESLRYYYLALGEDRKVMLSIEEWRKYEPLNFECERIENSPKGSMYYRMMVDTLGAPNVSYQGFFSADTLLRPDSLAVADTMRGDLSLWRFEAVDKVDDTTFYKIYNKATDSILAFDIPAGNDTVAYMNWSGELNQWRMTFFMEDDSVGKFMVRDTVSGRDFYLALKDTVVMLTTDTVNIKPLSLFIGEDGYLPPIVDSAFVYKVKILNCADPDSGKYLGADMTGARVTLDTVYAHLPDGQFVVNRDNRYSLMSRVSDIETDSLFEVCDTVTGLPIENLYTNHRAPADTFEIVAVTYGNMESLRYRQRLGYRHFSPEDQSSYTYIFAYSSADSLNERLISYDPADSLMILKAAPTAADSIRFTLEYLFTDSVGAPEIADIPHLQRDNYSIRLFDEDSTLFVTISSSKLSANVDSLKRPFYLKEDTVPELYYFVENYSEPDFPALHKALVDTAKHFNLALMDSIDTHVFTIIRKDREFREAPDPYTYLTELSEGAGMYELTVFQSGLTRWLTKNFYHYAVYAREGETQLRAGSFTPYDLQLWMDTARGTGFNPVRPSFYIVKDADTTDAKLSGYFLHVMDSISVPSHGDYVVGVGDKEYNRMNFVSAWRHSANTLLLNPDGASATARDSVGFEDKNFRAINEYRFYLQVSDDDPDKYLIATEYGYLDETSERGYLSMQNDKLYVGPRDAAAVSKISLSKSIVANEKILPPVVEDKSIAAIGGTGSIRIKNAKGQHVAVFNVVGQKIIDVTLNSDDVTIPASRGIVIVRIGEVKTKKVVVR